MEDITAQIKALGPNSKMRQKPLPKPIDVSTGVRVE
ncbi:hypothetical protein D7024_09675 [Desulfofundulus salinus]|uniref:Uncharacterized protein n=1 Tax=Desulfofundulus salinus TaxID=2419843 RepID=A0A494X2X2_9FIRM|nr:hypothetical protein D7024_09675 [Desulfofundulus salinum]